MAVEYPELAVGNIQYLTTDVFLGYENREKPAVGAFSDMRNLTSDRYPLLSVREKRGLYALPENPQGLLSKEALCYADGTALVINGYRVELGLSTQPADCPKRLLSMGAYILVFPDEKYLNTADYSDTGNLSARWRGRGVTAKPCARDGTPRNPGYIQPSPPEEPENSAIWLDTSATPHAVKQWSAAAAEWVEVTALYTRLECKGIGKDFRSGDGVEVSGFTGEGAGLNTTAVIICREEDYLVITGNPEKARTETAEITLLRPVPVMDFVIECGNRLWGCRYGLNAKGSYVNEIYASKLGDFRNWQYFAGTAADSYALSLGSDGKFTGAVNFLGYPLFFKEGCLHKILGQYPAQYTLQTTPCRGVQAGSGDSLAMVDEVLYYKSPEGVCAFDGSLPVEVGQDLGSTRYDTAAAGAIGGKYYLSMRNTEENTWMLAVLDTQRRLWHLEDALHISAFASCRGVLYGLNPESRRILTLRGGKGAEDSVSWMVQTGILDGGTPDAKFLSALGVRMALPPGSTAAFFLRYDSQGDWLPAGEVTGTGTALFTVPIRPRRCDHLQLCIRGSGEMRLYALTRAMEKGEALL